MAVWKCVINLNHASGIGENDYQQTFIVGTTDPFDPVTQALEIGGPLQDFYNLIQSTTVALGEMIGAQVVRGPVAHSISYYNITDHLDGSPHGSPAFVDAFALTAAADAGDAPPSEVAVVLTLRSATALDESVEVPDDQGAIFPDADVKPDRPRQRHSGRLYLGPLSNTAIQHDVNGEPRPGDMFMTTLLDAAEDVQDGLAINGHTWSVWSRKDRAARAVARVEVDNAFDTQRRRGVDATTRQSRVLIP